jgi:hypothetical protein
MLGARKCSLSICCRSSFFLIIRFRVCAATCKGEGQKQEMHGATELSNDSHHEAHAPASGTSARARCAGSLDAEGRQIWYAAGDTIKTCIQASTS